MEARFERHTSKDPKSNLTCTPKRDRDIDVEDPLSLRRKRNKTKSHSTTSCNTSFLLFVLNKYVYLLHINTF